MNAHNCGFIQQHWYGVFPLKGKPLNVREAAQAQVVKNDEIKNLVDIRGLKFGTVYNEQNIKTLRYGCLMIMADQDHDGSHIKGLVINILAKGTLRFSFMTNTSLFSLESAILKHPFCSKESPTSQ